QLDRASESASLFKQGFAPRILVSGNNKLVGPNTRPEENDFELGLLKGYLVEHGVPEAAILIDDQSFNSLGQATNVVKIAKENGWSTLLIVVSAYHALRSFLAFVKQTRDQAWSGKIVMNAVEFPWDTIPSGRKKTAREMLQVEVEKIKKYEKDLATVGEGLEYLKTL
ncbi:MAG: YdcF family protein, partial [bacterium]|nr:YdcF family protein [bacterium]